MFISKIFLKRTFFHLASRLCQLSVSRTNKYNKDWFHNDPFINVTYIRNKRVEGEIGTEGVKSVYFLSMSSEAGYRMAHALTAPRSIPEAIDR